jgi:hypothetical protein
MSGGIIGPSCFMSGGIFGAHTSTSTYVRLTDVCSVVCCVALLQLAGGGRGLGLGGGGSLCAATVLYGPMGRGPRPHGWPMAPPVLVLGREPTNPTPAPAARPAPPSDDLGAGSTGSQPPKPKPTNQTTASPPVVGTVPIWAPKSCCLAASGRTN